MDKPREVLFFSPEIPEEITEIETGIFGRIKRTPLSPPDIPGIKLNGVNGNSQKKFPDISVILARLSSSENSG